jgi:hypothetical protein
VSFSKYYPQDTEHGSGVRRELSMNNAIPSNSKASYGGSVARTAHPRCSCRLRFALIAVLCFVAMIPLLLHVTAPLHSRKDPALLTGISSDVMPNNMRYESQVPFEISESTTSIVGQASKGDNWTYIYSPEEYADITQRLERSVGRLKQQVKALRDSHTVQMPVDPGAVALTTRLQDATRCSLMHRYKGHVNRPIIVRVAVSFPRVMIDGKLGPLFEGDSLCAYVCRCLAQYVLQCNNTC